MKKLFLVLALIATTLTSYAQDESTIVPSQGDKVEDVQPLNPDDTEVKGGTITITVLCAEYDHNPTDNVSWTGFGMDANGGMWSLESRLTYSPKLGRYTFKVFAKRYTSSVYPC